MQSNETCNVCQESKLNKIDKMTEIKFNDQAYGQLNQLVGNQAMSSLLAINIPPHLRA